MALLCFCICLLRGVHRAGFRLRAGVNLDLTDQYYYDFVGLAAPTPQTNIYIYIYVCVYIYIVLQYIYI